MWYGCRCRKGPLQVQSRGPEQQSYNSPSRMHPVHDQAEADKIHHLASPYEVPTDLPPRHTRARLVYRFARGTHALLYTTRWIMQAYLDDEEPSRLGPNRGGLAGLQERHLFRQVLEHEPAYQRPHGTWGCRVRAAFRSRETNSYCTPRSGRRRAKSLQRRCKLPA